MAVLGVLQCFSLVFVFVLGPRVAAAATVCGRWTRTNDVIGRVGVVAGLVSTLDQCKTACANSYSNWCVAVNWIPTHLAGQYCWLLDNTSTEPVRHRRPRPITHHRLNRTCIGQYSHN